MIVPHSTYRKKLKGAIKTFQKNNLHKNIKMNQRCLSLTKSNTLGIDPPAPF